MTILRTIVQGLRQAVSAPKLVILLWLVNLAAAVPATLMLSASLSESFGTSLVAENMRRGFDTAWFGEFEAEASGLAETFSLTVSGPGPVLDTLESWWNGEMFTGYSGLVALGISYALLWAFLLGGVFGRLASPQERMGLDRFSRSGGRFFLRFLGLALVSGVFYCLVYLLGRLLFRTIRVQTRDVTEEKTVLLLVLLAAALVVFLLSFIRLVFDYAKIATVLEDRGNVFRSAWTGLRTVLRNPVRTLGVYFGFGVLALLLLALYALAAPGAGQSGFLGVLLAFLFGQVYLALRLIVRVGLLSGQLSLYRAVVSSA